MKKRRLTPFGEKIKERLIELNITQKKLAQQIGTSDVYLSMILYGERTGEKYIKAMMEYLDLQADQYPDTKQVGKRYMEQRDKTY